MKVFFDISVAKRLLHKPPISYSTFAKLKRRLKLKPFSELSYRKSYLHLSSRKVDVLWTFVRSTQRYWM